MEDVRKEAKKLMDTDPLAEAEKLTGESYKTSKATESLGFLMHMEKNKKVEALLTALDDTTFRNDEKEYIRKITEFGFEKALELPFVNENDITERMYVFFHPRLGILLKFDTFTWGDDGSWAKAGKSVPPPSINGGKFYYNWSPHPGINRHNYTSSGGFIFKKEDRFCTMFDEDFNVIDQSNLNIPPDLSVCSNPWPVVQKRNEEISEALKKIPHRLVWYGDHDCREGLKLNITNLIDNGKFLPKWKMQPFLWLLHYMDTKEGYDHEKITEERIAMLPEHVRNAITPEEWQR